MYRREPYSFSADIWSLGCTLHELCTGRQLFDAATGAVLGERASFSAVGRRDGRVLGVDQVLGC